MGSDCLKGVLGKVIVDEKGIQNSWKEYMEKLMNEENEWDHRISAGVPADASGLMKLLWHLKKMKRQKPQPCQPSSRNDINHRGCWNSLDIGFM